MNNIICIFFGHKDDKLTFQGDYQLKITHTVDFKEYILANFRCCGRCEQIYLQTHPRKMVIP